ncbi:MAG: hypothetical protein AAF191_01955 [Verrucomicrobiota bacterium]
MAGHDACFAIGKPLPGDPNPAVTIGADVGENVIPASLGKPKGLSHGCFAAAADDSRHEIPLTVGFQLGPDAEVAAVWKSGEAGLRDVGHAFRREGGEGLEGLCPLELCECETVLLSVMLDEGNDRFAFGIEAQGRAGKSS